VNQPRSSADHLLLVDCLQIAITVAALVDLALPWWRYNGGQTEHVVTGWGALGDPTYGNGWGLIGAVVLTGAAAVLRRRWAAIAGALFGLLGALLVLVSAASLQHSGFDYAQGLAGSWVGGVLALCAAAGQVAAAVALSRP
jgi:hypothetical protein